MACKDYRGDQPRGLILAYQAVVQLPQALSWSGASPGLQSQLHCYASGHLQETAKKEDRYHSVPVWYKACVAAFANAPLDLIATRKQTDHLFPGPAKELSLMPPAVAKVYREEGIRGLWKGSLPITLKMIVLNVGMLASYDRFLEFQPDIWQGLSSWLRTMRLFATVC